jgi:hypothetical protein
VTPDHRLEIIPLFQPLMHAVVVHFRFLWYVACSLRRSPEDRQAKGTHHTAPQIYNWPKTQNQALFHSAKSHVHPPPGHTRQPSCNPFTKIFSHPLALHTICTYLEA